MLELAKRDEQIVRADISKDDALKMFGDRGENYKCELISELEDGHITTYTQGAFTDLCRGPHIPSTGVIKAAKVMSLAGAYWRGDEKRNQLVRVYGITFPKVCPCGCRRAPLCATAWSSSSARSSASMATSR